MKWLPKIPGPEQAYCCCCCCCHACPPQPLLGLALVHMPLLHMLGMAFLYSSLSLLLLFFLLFPSFSFSSFYSCQPTVAYGSQVDHPPLIISAVWPHFEVLLQGIPFYILLHSPGHLLPVPPSFFFIPNPYLFLIPPFLLFLLPILPFPVFPRTLIGLVPCGVICIFSWRLVSTFLRSSKGSLLCHHGMALVQGNHHQHILTLAQGTTETLALVQGATTYHKQCDFVASHGF